MNEKKYIYPDTEKLILKESGENWFHFREKTDSLYGSFTITFTYDKHTVITGDYGCFAWHTISRYFPHVKTNLDYFISKIDKSNWNTYMYVFDIDKAKTEIEEMLKENNFNKNDQKRIMDEVEDILTSGLPDDVIQYNMYDYLTDELNDVDIPEYNFGKEVDPVLKQIFPIICEALEIINATVNKNDQ